MIPIAKIRSQIVWIIARFTRNGKDLDALRYSSGPLLRKLDGSRYFFWRSRFTDTYDDIGPLAKPDQGQGEVSSLIYKEIYRDRQEYMVKPVSFADTVWRDSQSHVLHHLREMVVQSYPVTEEGSGKNMALLVKFCKDCDMMGTVLNPAVIRLCNSSIKYRYLYCLLVAILFPIAPFLRENTRLRTARSGRRSRHKYRIYDFPKSQNMAYSSRVEHPIFDVENRISIHESWLLHNANFWRCHLTLATESTLHDAFRALAPEERPRAWQSKLCDSIPIQPLGKYWKGIYSFVTQRQMSDARTDGNLANPLWEIFSTEDDEGEIDGFDDYTFDFDGEDVFWPPPFETCVKASVDPNIPVHTSGAIPFKVLKKREE